MTRHVFSRFALVTAFAVTLAACNATTTSTVKERSAPARIEIQEAIGFTITEEARVDGETRVDYEHALGLLEQGRLDEGIAALERVAEEAPDLSAPRIDLGIAYHRMNELAAAETQLVQALEINPQHPIALNELAGASVARVSAAEAYMATVHADDEASMWLKDVRYRMGRKE